MSTKIQTYLIRAALIALTASMALAMWQPWMTLGAAAGLGASSACAPVALIALLCGAARTVASPATVDRALAIAAFIFTATLAAAALGMAFSLHVRPEVGGAPWWLTAAVVSVPVACLGAGIAVYRLGDSRAANS